MSLIRPFAWFVLALVLLPGMPAAAQDARLQVRAEIERLQQSLKAKPTHIPGLADMERAIGAKLGEAHSAVTAGRWYYGLEKLIEAQEYLYGARLLQEKSDTVKGLPAFEAEWGKASVKLTALDEQGRARNWSNKPAAIRALSETAQGKTIPLLEGGRGFATATGPANGLVYLGMAEGAANFATFVSALDVRTKATPPPLRSYLPELQRLQRKTNAAFVPPRSIDLHARFIALNSALKLAGELDARKSYAGALYQYLDAVRNYALLDAVAPGAARQAGLKDAIARKANELENAARDESIALMFLDRAQFQLARADGTAPTAEEWRGALVTIEQVLPAYYEALKPAGPLQRPAMRTVDVTLVRWPYT